MPSPVLNWLSAAVGILRQTDKSSGFHPIILALFLCLLAGTPMLLLSGGNLLPPQFDVGTNIPSQQDSVLSLVELSVSANETEIAEKTKEAIDPLTTAFGGYDLGRAFIQSQVTKLLQRKL